MEWKAGTGIAVPISAGTQYEITILPLYIYYVINFPKSEVWESALYPLYVTATSFPYFCISYEWQKILLPGDNWKWWRILWVDVFFWNWKIVFVVKSKQFELFGW